MTKKYNFLCNKKQIRLTNREVIKNEQINSKINHFFISLILVSQMFAFQSYAKIDLGTCVGTWLFDEGNGDIAKDSSGNGNDGKINGATWVNGKFSKALSFNSKAWGVPDLAVEVVSPSNEDDDRVEKFAEYAKAGINEYWIVDPVKLSIEIYLLEKGKYSLKEKKQSGEIVSSSVLNGFEFSVDNLK
jgi:hypothetical protein